ncbi:MAG: RNA polymerase sigma-54 factor [Firmicutes bacterium HGW-Firmicutes-7]|nr:MAG: RNA polymerase sigma-54 factor [Firmicutes bacterium HGW-Firmicutes-7]
MKMEFNQEMALKQNLVITQELQQALKILQLPLQDLHQEIYQEYQENPLLEVADMSDQQDADGLDEVLTCGISYKELIRQFEDASYTNISYTSEQKQDDPYCFVSQRIRLIDYIYEQIQDFQLDKSWSTLCYFLAENLDERGYFDESLEDLSLEIGLEKAHLEKALFILQTLKPDGIGARNLKECLIIQLKKKKITDHNLFRIIEDHLEFLGDFKHKKIASEMNLELETIVRYHSIIKSLEPYPSRGFYTGEVDQYIAPEAYIREMNGQFIILMNDRFIPTLKINAIYKEILTQKTNKETNDYIKDRLKRAQNFIKNIENRNRTLYRVIEAIVERQQKYLQLGHEYLNPMLIKDIALELSLHESTVSRAIKGKYVYTPHHLILIKDLFTIGIATDNANITSTNIIKKAIAHLINDENTSKPLSDQDLSNLLESQNMPISRRTVAKYREEMSILTSSKRKANASIQKNQQTICN